MVLDVTGRQVAFLLALELGKQHGRCLAQGIDQDVQATAVRHADDDFVETQATTGTDGFVHGDDQRFTAFKRKTLLADVLGVQVTLQRFCGSQALQDALLLISVVGRTGADAFQALLQPALLVVIRHVHVLDTHGAAVRLFQGLQNIAELGVVRQALEGTDTEGLVEIGVGKAIEGRLQFVDLRTG